MKMTQIKPCITQNQPRKTFSPLKNLLASAAMEADPDIGVWILEFLLRQPSISDETLKSITSSLTLPSHSPNLCKSVHLRRIQTDFSTGPVSENVLDLLQLILAVDPTATPAMKRAYWCVSVECTVRSSGDAGEYFEAVKRVWREREKEVEESGLGCEEYEDWREMVEAAVWDKEGMARLRRRWREGEALEAVKEYVEEAWGEMGLSFLEVVAGDCEAREALGIRGVDSIVCDREKEKMPCDGMEVWPSRENEVLLQHSLVNNNLDKVAMANDATGKVSGLSKGDKASAAPEIRREEIAAQMDNAPVTMTNDATWKVSGLKEGDEAPRDPDIRQEEIAAENNVTINDDESREMSPSGDNQVLHQTSIINNMNNAAMNDDETRISPSVDNQALHQTSITDNLKNMTMSDDTLREGFGMTEGDETCTASELRQGNITSDVDVARPRRRKRVANKRTRKSVSGTSRGAKITDTEQINQDISNRYGSLPSPEIVKIQEALRGSVSELKSVVNDPLPEAIEVAEMVISSKNTEGPSTDHQSYAPKPSLMTRNSSARTYKWDDSIDALSEGDEEHRSKINLPSPKYRPVSPLHKYEMKNLGGRRKKRWSVLEEDTLRTGVDKYGKGRWKTILNAYPDIFEERSDVDLKDKWRNLTR